MKKEIIDLLKNKKEMKRRRLFVVDTVKILEEAVNAKCVVKFFLYSSKGADVYEECRNYVRVGAEKVKESYIERYSTVKNHQDFIAVVEAGSTLIKETKGTAVLMDNIQDPANMGAIIRNGLAFNINNYYLHNCVYPFNEKVIRSSAGAVFRMRYSEVDKEGIKELRKQYSFVVTDVKKGGDISEAAENAEKLMIVMGSEGRGVSEFINSLADIRVRINYPNKSIESLNVASAAAILFYEISKLKS